MATNQGNAGSTAVAQRPASGYLPLRQAMDRLFQDSFLAPSFFSDFWSNSPSLGGGNWTNAAALAGTNLWETNEGYYLQIAMPGMNPDSIDCTVEQNVVTCKAQPAIAAPQNATPVWQGFGGQAAYKIALPGEVESGQAQATYENGVLTISLPKAVHARTHSIRVTAK